MTSHSKRCPTCGRVHRRSNPQNALYWLLLHKISEAIRPKHEQYSAETWHQYFKARFLGMNDVILPSRKVIQVPVSTADLEVPEFADYFDKVQAFASERGVWLEDM